MEHEEKRRMGKKIKEGKKKKEEGSSEPVLF